MNNKGLEALAALASAAPASPTAPASAAPAPAGETIAPALAPALPGNTQHQADSKPEVSTVQQTASLPTLDGIVQQGTTTLQLAGAVNTQQLQQALASRGVNQANLAPSHLAPTNVLAGLQQQISQTDAASLLASMQQVNYLKYLIQAQAQQNLTQVAAPPPSPNQTLQLNLNGAGTPLLQKADEKLVVPGPAVLPNASAGNMPATPKVAAASSMPPPKPMPAQPITVSTASVPSPQQHPMIAPQPSFASSSSFGNDTDFEAQLKNKKQQKRAANRRSAQLSRKRKKQFIEELKEENDELRRREQILLSIPDLIVVFDSSGKLWFVSKSVSRFLSFSAEELEGTSFWDRLCQDSVRLLKAAFMDSLAARDASDSDAAPLGSGVWELRLVDKDGSQKIVALSGVVHFNGDRPECVCSIRPRDELVEPSSAAPERSSSDSFLRSLIRVQPHQSVVSTTSSISRGKARKKAKRGEAVRISDSGNSSVESESGSSDEMTGATTWGECASSDEVTGAAS